MNENHVIQGSLDNYLKFAWQDENGTLYLAILLSNGTGGNRYYSAFQLTLTDDNLGTVYDGDLEDNIIQGSFSVMDGRNELIVSEVDAGEVWTGTQTWGSMSGDIHTSNR